MPEPTTRTAALPPLTESDVIVLAAIVAAAKDGARVARLMPDGHPLAGQIVYGTARHIVTDVNTAAFPGSGDDIRACYLRVTTTFGGEAFWPVTELADAYRSGEFGVDVDAP